MPICDFLYLYVFLLPFLCFPPCPVFVLSCSGLLAYFILFLFIFRCLLLMTENKKECGFGWWGGGGKDLGGVGGEEL